MKVTNTNKVAIDLKNTQPPMRLREARRRFERAYVDDVMKMYEGDKHRAARALGISLSSIKEKLQPGFGGRA